MYSANFAAPKQLCLCLVGRQYEMNWTKLKR